MKKIIVIGAGASGIMAAGQAALHGGDVLLLEKMKRPAAKIAISGKGRCNITNDSDIHDFLGHFNSSGRFLHQAFASFFVPELMEFFTSKGLPLVIERGGRVFPASGKSEDVVETLLQWLHGGGTRLQCRTPVTALCLTGGRVNGVVCGTTIHHSDAVILATGGASYPATGSTGDGYHLAKEAGHSIVALRPALVPLVADLPVLPQMAGLDLRNVSVRIFVDNKRKKVDFGEVGFSHSAIGGPVILTHSRFIVDCLRDGKSVELALDLKPALDTRKLDARIQRDLLLRRDEKLESVLRGLLPEKMITACLALTSLDGNAQAGTISSEERRRLGNWLKNFRFPITGHRPLKEAIVTAGGVNVREVDPRTMESLQTKGLYITGEVLDIDGDTGGYNLQAAFSTGWLAGRSAATS